MSISATDVISPAFNHMKKQLFQPFRIGVWLRYAVLGLATGEVFGSGGCNGANFNVPARTTHDRGSEFLSGLPNLPEHFWIYLAMAMVAIFALMFVWMYISSVFRFVLFDSVLTGNIGIRKGWNKWQEQGASFFGFQLALMFSMWALLAVLIGVPALAIFAATKGKVAESQHLAPIVLAIVLIVCALFVLVILTLLITVMAKDFVVPIMALERLRFTEAFRRFWPILKAERGGFAGYIGMKIVLAIGAAFMTGIVILTLALALGIPGALIGAGVVAAGAAMGLTWNPLTITLAVFAGIILLIVLLYAIGVVCTPVTVFFPAYAMYFFAGRYPALTAILSPPPPPEEPPATPSPEPEPQPAM